MIINMNGAKAPETPSPVLQEKTVTPETLPTVIGADEGYDGLSQVTVNPDAQLKAENIRSGKTIFGVAGAFVGETQYATTLDATDWYYDSVNGFCAIIMNKENYVPIRNIMVTTTAERETIDFPGYAKGAKIKHISSPESLVIRTVLTRDAVDTYTFSSSTGSDSINSVTMHLSVNAGVHTFNTYDMDQGTYDIEYIKYPIICYTTDRDNTVVGAPVPYTDVTGVDPSALTMNIEKARVIVRYVDYRKQFDLEIPSFDCDVTAYIPNYAVDTYKNVGPNVGLALVSATLVK